MNLLFAYKREPLNPQPILVAVLQVLVQCSKSINGSHSAVGRPLLMGVS